MKQLLLVRHAQTEPISPTGKDLDRILTTKGLSDARKIATYLKEEGFSPNFLYTSTAIRTQQTADVFLDVLSVEKNKRRSVARLYGPSIFDFYTFIEQIPDDYHTVAIFSHNPGISDFINDLDCHSHIRMVPGCCFGVEVGTESWKDFMGADKKLFLYRIPKDLY